MFSWLRCMCVCIYIFIILFLLTFRPAEKMTKDSKHIFRNIMFSEGIFSSSEFEILSNPDVSVYTTRSSKFSRVIGLALSDLMI